MSGSSIRPKPKKGYLLTKDVSPKLLIDSKAGVAVSRHLSGYVAYDIKESTWAIWRDTHWERLTDNSEAKREIAKQVEIGTDPRGYANAYLNAIVEQIQVADRLPLPPMQTGVVPFIDGLLDVHTSTLKAATPTYSTDYVLPHKHGNTSDCQKIHEWLLRSVDEDKQTVELLRAWLACLVRGIYLQKILILRGLGGTGKGTFQRLAVALVGQHNTATSALRDLEKNRFEMAKHYGKRLCLINEAGKYTGELNMLKAMTGGDWLPLERKNQQQTGGFQYGGLVLMATNDEFTASGTGEERRKIIIRFDRKATEAEQQQWHDAGGESAVLHKEIPGLIRWLLQLSESDIRDRIERLPERVIKDNRLGMRAGNSVADWMVDCCICDPDARTQIGQLKPGDPMQDRYMYPHYRNWCEETGRKAVAHNTFANRVIEVASDTGYSVTREIERTESAKKTYLAGIRFAENPESYFDESGSSESSRSMKDTEPVPTVLTVPTSGDITSAEKSETTITI